MVRHAVMSADSFYREFSEVGEFNTQVENGT